MKKTSLFIAVAFVLIAGLGRAESDLRLDANTDTTSQSSSLQAASLNAPSGATLTGRGSDFARGLDRASSASFAQLNGPTHHLPLPPVWMLVAFGLAILAARIFGIHHAKGMADHEIETHRAKRQMYRSLQERA